MPSSNVLRKEEMSAWQRWELDSLAAPASKAEAERAAQDAMAAERARVLAEARAAGLAQGRAEAQAEQARLAALADTLTHCVADHEQRLVDEVLDLALLLARQMVGEALSVKRDLLLPVVSAALRQLPQTTQRVDIVVTPDRAKLLSAPRDAQGRPIRDVKTLDPHDAATAAAASIAGASTNEGETAPPASKKKPVRTVGPTFVPSR